jgi:cyclophilin family peptidyl-prolyl cis-trans isomerase
VTVVATWQDGAMAKPPAMEIDTNTIYTVTLGTPKGTDRDGPRPALAPNSVNHFVVLARQGFYTGLTFHRVVPGFVIQGGDPEGSGRGGPGYRWNDEPVKAEYTVGAVAMANAGPNTNGSQFFICIDDCTRKLDKLYNLFGYVTQGVDVAQAIGVGDTIDTVEVTERPAA